MVTWLGVQERAAVQRWIDRQLARPKAAASTKPPTAKDWDELIAASAQVTADSQATDASLLRRLVEAERRLGELEAKEKPDDQ